MKIRDKNMKEWHIWDLPSNLYVLLKEEVRGEFFREMYRKLGTQLAYADYLTIERNGIQGYHYARYWYKGKRCVRFMPLSVLQRSLPLMENALKVKIQNNVEEIRSKGGRGIVRPVFPIRESPTLYRIMAHMIGDGNDSHRHTPYYANTCKELRNQFKKDLQIFGQVYYYESTPNTVPCVHFLKVVTRILGYLFKVKFTHTETIPQLIFEATDECKAAFLQALFDDEGTITASLTIGMNNKNVINQLKNLLTMLNIETRKVISAPYFTKTGPKCMFQLTVYPKGYKKFKEKIDFRHPKKIALLSDAIATKNRKIRTRPKEFIESEIIKILEFGPQKTIDLANRLQFTLSGVLHHLHSLLEEGAVVKKGQKNKVLWDLA